MNQVSAFEYVCSDLEQFQNTHVYYSKTRIGHRIFLTNSIVDITSIYILRYDKEKDNIIIFYRTSDYESIYKINIEKSGKLENVFELFEWLVPKLVTLT
jgi:hypothetical protein